MSRMKINTGAIRYTSEIDLCPIFLALYIFCHWNLTDYKKKWIYDNHINIKQVHCNQYWNKSRKFRTRILKFCGRTPTQ
jgi:hypothetical protein